MNQPRKYGYTLEKLSHLHIKNIGFDYYYHEPWCKLWDFMVKQCQMYWARGGKATHGKA